jgi:hypothetical protein
LSLGETVASKVFAMIDLPPYVWLIVLVAAVAMPSATAVALYRDAIAAGLGGSTATRVAVAFSALLLGWIVVNAWRAGADTYRANAAFANPGVPVATLGGTAVLLLLTGPVIATILAQAGTAARLAVPQANRVAGVAFLIAMALGQLPAVFALPAGLGDIAIGLTAPFIAWRLSRGAGRRGAVRFNVLGILDLVVALSLGVLTDLGPTEVIASDPSTVAATVLPLALIPTTAVPPALHVVSLRRLGRRGGATSVAARPTAAGIRRASGRRPHA